MKDKNVLPQLIFLFSEVAFIIMLFAGVPVKFTVAALGVLCSYYFLWQSSKEQEQPR